MAKLNDYDWKGLNPDLVEFLQDITSYWNTGRIPLQNVGAPPTSTTQADGPLIRLEKDGASWFLYCYTNETDGWKKVALSDI